VQEDDLHAGGTGGSDDPCGVTSRVFV
jgi:hypothetical protein